MIDTQDQTQIQRWLKSNKPVIDCRQAIEFDELHLLGSVNIPAKELFNRMHEFPKKSETLLLIVDSRCQTEVTQFFNERQFNVESFCLWKDNIAEECFLTSGRSDHRLWQPAPFVTELQKIMSAINLPEKTVIDVGCGAGRDIIHLATQGFEATGIDYSESALERCRTTADNLKVSLNLHCLNLEKSFEIKSSEIEKKQFGCVLVCRYLHRPLFNELKQWILPKGIIAYQTFMAGSEKIGSPRNPNFLLKKGELAETFSDFSILLDKIEYLDDGRPMSAFVAQKK